MRILSLFYGHDANCTLMEDGEPVVVLEKERLTRIKHDSGPMDIEAILTDYGWSPETIDVVVISPWIKPTADGRLAQWRLQGETFQERSDYKTTEWCGPVENRFSRHRIHLFDRRYDCFAGQCTIDVQALAPSCGKSRL